MAIRKRPAEKKKFGDSKRTSGGARSRPESGYKSSKKDDSHSGFKKETRPYKKRSEDAVETKGGDRKYSRDTPNKRFTSAKPSRPYGKTSEESRERTYQPKSDIDKYPKRPFNRAEKSTTSKPERPYKKRTPTDDRRGSDEGFKRPTNRFDKLRTTKSEGPVYERKKTFERSERSETKTNRRPEKNYPDKKSDAPSGRSFQKDGPRNNKFNSPGSNRSSFKKDRFSKKKIENEDTFEPNGDTRLNKYISNAGICSRREADKLIGAGLVSVNGVTVTEMGYQVKPGDVVKYNNSKLSTDKKVYLLMNKPKDTITTLDDPDDRRIVTDLLKGEDLPRVYPVGRLDRNTTGVLLLTNDGELAQRLMHPKYEVKKVYKATLFKNIKGEDLWALSNGVELEDGFIKPDGVALPDPTVKNEVGIEIHSGRNRIVHRMFEHIGYPLEKLDRVAYAGMTKKALKKGAWRHLEPRELMALLKMVKLK